MDWAKTSLLIVLIILLLLLNLLKILLKPLWRFLLGSRLPVIVRTPEERFQGLDKLGYDFGENYLRWSQRWKLKLALERTIAKKRGKAEFSTRCRGIVNASSLMP